MSSGQRLRVDQRLVVDDVGVVGSAVAGDVEALAEIRLGILVDRRMAHDLPAERQVTDVVLADLERELIRFGAGEESLGDGERVVDQMLRHAVIGDDEKPGVFAGAGNGTRQRRGRARLAGEIRADIEHRNAALSRGLGLGCCETHVMSPVFGSANGRLSHTRRCRDSNSANSPMTMVDRHESRHLPCSESTRSKC
jgi:hypothetical protein